MTAEVVQTAASNTEINNQKLAGESLKDAIKRQVEFYFSKQNLSNDAYLVSHMNSQMFVPIDTIIQFSKVKELTDSKELIADAIRNSNVCSLNAEENAIKPNVKTERNTIILREIPSETPEEQVKAIFEGCGNVVNVRSDVGDTWFVTMESESAAVSTLLALRNKTFNDNQIKARLKSENILRSFYPAVSAESGNQPPYNTNAGSYFRGNQTYYGGSRGNYGNGVVRHSEGSNRYNGRNGRNGNRGRNFHNNSKEGGRKGFSERSGNRKQKDKKGGNSPAGHNAEKRVSNNVKERQPVLNVANFPPLPTADKAVHSDDAQTIKYKYSHDDIMEMVRNMSTEDCELKNNKLDYAAHSVALTEKAHPDLLRNQRTYSIEQAREAMRQGRPIRSDSVGSVDYDSMMYGEEMSKEIRKAKESTPKKAVPESKTKVDGNTESSPVQNKNEPQQEPQPKRGGYAAALINGATAPTPKRQPKKVVKSSSKKEEKNTTPAKPAIRQAKSSPNLEKEPSSMETSSPTAESTTVVQAEEASAWGGKRSFVDVLKTKSIPVQQPTIEVKEDENVEEKSENSVVSATE